jgi:hypothetical protein
MTWTWRRILLIAVVLWSVLVLVSLATWAA